VEQWLDEWTDKKDELVHLTLVRLNERNKTNRDGEILETHLKEINSVARAANVEES